MRQYQLGWRAVIDIAENGYNGSIGKWLYSKQKSHFEEDICISAVLPIIVSLHFDALIREATEDEFKERSKYIKETSYKIIDMFHGSRTIPLDSEIVEYWLYLLKLNALVKDSDGIWDDLYVVKLAELATASVGRFGQGFYYVDALPVGKFDEFPDLVVEIPYEQVT